MRCALVCMDGIAAAICGSVLACWTIKSFFDATSPPGPVPTRGGSRTLPRGLVSATPLLGIAGVLLANKLRLLELKGREGTREGDAVGASCRLNSSCALALSPSSDSGSC
eukprot:GDKJ01030029.1.p2 GENE.GDKJ01030029.1~~GDKJ01030029.1.p2  ORF type:complete len:110 (-),score=10.53 GDKJ01030029.1:223-552(-)